MKYIIVLGDGMADYHKGELGFHTPLELAKKPNIDFLASRGTVGLIRTVDASMSPGSDVANLSVLGYDPSVCYTGRSPLEALSIGVHMNADDTVFRVNFVTLSGGSLDTCVMTDYSAGEITSDEGRELMTYLKEHLDNGCIEFFAGTSYRNVAVLRGSSAATELTPPHDITGKPIKDYLPKGEGQEIFYSLIERSMTLLKDHPVNRKRREEGKNEANALWFWGKGTKPQLEDFTAKTGLKGAVISAVDLLKGIAIGAGMDVISVDGATGNLHSNFAGKAQACIDALKTHDFVYLHIEAPDECGHQGDAKGKIEAIEKVDWVTGFIKEQLDSEGQEYCIAVLPDHATPLCLRTHVSDPVPYLVYNSLRPGNSGLAFTEDEGQKGLYLNNGRALIQLMLKS